MNLLLAAVPLETRLIRQQLTEVQKSTQGLLQILSGQLFGQDVLLAHSGIGIVNMALTIQQLLDRHHIEQVFLFGCGGSYPSSGLSNGDLVLADSETYGDLGVETSGSFLSLEGVGQKNNDIQFRNVQNLIMFKKSIINKAKTILKNTPSGPFVSVNCCSGTPTLARKMEQRTAGLCENMEGAAAAQVCSERGISIIELRGISNPVGTRDDGQWDLIKGAESAQRGLMTLLEAWQTTERADG